MSGLTEGAASGTHDDLQPLAAEAAGLPMELPPGTGTGGGTIAAMRPSPALAQATLDFYARFSANDVAGFDDVVAQAANMFIGTAEEEWFRDRLILRSGFAFDGLRLEPGAPIAFEEGSVGWVADRPTMYAPGFGALRTRFTGVFHREDGVWKLVASHFSIGVPDDIVMDLQRGTPHVQT